MTIVARASRIGSHRAHIGSECSLASSRDPCVGSARRGPSRRGVRAVRTNGRAWRSSAHAGRHSGGCGHTSIYNGMPIYGVVRAAVKDLARWRSRSQYPYRSKGRVCSPLRRARHASANLASTSSTARNVLSPIGRLRRGWRPDYPTTRNRLPFSPARHLRLFPRSRPALRCYMRTTGTRRSPPSTCGPPLVIARRVDLATVLSVHNAGFQGHHAPGIMPELGLSWEPTTGAGSSGTAE